MLFRLTRQHWLILIAVVFSAYVAILLANAYRSQWQLRTAAETRMMADNRQVAALISDFLAEQQNFVRNLSESHELGTFLTNKALGMSMRYGLNANLYDIEESFRRKLGEKTTLGETVYDRIVYFDEEGTPLADTAPDDSVPTLERDAVPRLHIDDEHGWIIAAARVDYRGTPGGTVMTVSKLSLLSRFLTSSTLNLGFRQFLITDAGRELTASGSLRLDGSLILALTTLPPGVLTPLRALHALEPSRFSEDYDLIMRIPVAGTSLSLVTALPEALLYGHITSWNFLYLASITPAILLLAALWVERMRRRTLRLEADVVDSNRNRAELQGRNDALTLEIERRKALERRLRESEERYRTYIEHAPEGIFVSDLSGRFVDVNPSGCAMTGFTRTALLGMTVIDLSPPGLEKEHACLLEQVLRVGAQQVEIGLRRQDRVDIVVNLRTIVIPGELVMGFCVDVTERKLAEEQIRNLAYFDPLTGLPNRRLLLDRLRQAMAISHRNRDYGALIMLDLDHFKNLNDTQGHDVGDRLLIEVARRLSASVRQENTVSRLGGDEYIIVAGELGRDESSAALQAEMIAENLHLALAQPYVLTPGRPAHHSSASVGVVLFCGQDLALDVLLKQADVALYQAKSAGRNSIRFFNQHMQATIDARAQMEADLRRAIREKELRLYYQPQVDRHGRISGAEALLRWIPPEGEPVPPGCFIPLAEETGLIIPIGAFVLEQACTQLQRWQTDPQTRALTLSINVSARQFHQPDFVEQVCAQIAYYGIAPSLLKLELTESVVLDRIDQIIERMRKLKDFGVGFSLDDFGTGYSSLSYLKRLPLDQVKIDQSFVRDITHDQNDAAIVRAVLAMSQSLGLNVIAEGVETEEQHALLLRYGCEHYQGYLFGKPAPIEAFLSTGCE